MPYCKWSELTHLQLGRYAEYYAMMELASYGCEIYRTEVDQDGIDFIAREPVSKDVNGEKRPPSKIIEGFPVGNWVSIQVKSVRNEEVTAQSRVLRWKYTFIKRDKVKEEELHWVMYLQFLDGFLPRMFLFPASVWWTEPSNTYMEHVFRKSIDKTTNEVVEYGISYSHANKNGIKEFLLDPTSPYRETQGLEEAFTDSVTEKTERALTHLCLDCPVTLPWDDEAVLDSIKKSLK